MNLDLTTIITSGAIVIFLTQQIKILLPDSANRYIPLVALTVGIVIQLINDLALSGASDSASIWTSIVTGAAVGMAAAGAYDLAGHTRGETPPAQIYVDETYIPAGEETYMPADLPEVAPDQLSDETRANLDWNQR